MVTCIYKEFWFQVQLHSKQDGIQGLMHIAMFYGWVDSKAETCQSVAIITIVFGIFSL